MPVFIEKVLLSVGAVAFSYLIWINPMKFDWIQRSTLGLSVLLFLFSLSYTLHLRNEAIRLGHPAAPEQSTQAVPSATTPNVDQSARDSTCSDVYGGKDVTIKCSPPPENKNATKPSP